MDSALRKEFQSASIGTSFPRNRGREEQAESRIEHRLRVEGALVAASRILVSNGLIDFEELLGTIGEAVDADCVYLVTMPPDELLIQESGAEQISDYRTDGQDSRPYVELEQGKSVTVWQRKGAGVSLQWLQHLDDDPQSLRNPPPPDADPSSQSPVILAVPILSSQDKLYGYIGFEYETVRHDWLDEDSRVLGVLGDILSSYFERRIASQAQRESEERWRSLVERNPEPILILANRLILYVNDSGAALLGGESTDMIVGRTMHDFVSAEEHSVFDRKVAAMVEESFGPEEQVIIRLDGSERVVEWFSVPIRYRGKRAAQVVLRDITERKLAERALQESEMRFRNLADSAPVMIWMAGPDGRCTYVNQTWLRFTGRSLEDEVGDGWQASVHQEDLLEVVSTFQGYLERGEAFKREFRLRRHDGVYRWIVNTGVPRFTSDGKLVGYIGSCLDITERKEALETIRESEERYRSFVETISEAIWRIELNEPMPQDLTRAQQVKFIGKHGVLAECNDALVRLVGANSRRDLIGMNGRKFFHLLGLTVVEDFVNSQYRLKNGEYIIHLGPNKRRHFLVNAVGLVRRQGLVRIWGSCNDVTDRVELEQQMVAALEEQQERFGRDLHDGVGQLLTAVRMLSSNLAERFFTEEEDGYNLAKKVVQFAEDASQRVREIHNGLAPFHLYQDGLIVVLNDMVQDINALPGVSCQFKTDDKVNVTGREEMLHLYRIAQEATNNALKYAHSSEIQVSLTCEDDCIVLQIMDNGTGFDPNQMADGKSLGLRSMHYRARSIGGTLTIESRKDGANSGTCVRCVVPIHGNAQSPKQPAQTEDHLL